MCVCVRGEVGLVLGEGWGGVLEVGGGGGGGGGGGRGEGGEETGVGEVGCRRAGTRVDERVGGGGAGEGRVEGGERCGGSEVHGGEI